MVIWQPHQDHRARCCGRQHYVNAIASGPVLTPGFEDYLERASAEQAKRLCQLVPLGRIGRPEESAPLAVHLASDEHSVIGQQGFLRKAVRSWSDTCRHHALSRPAPMESVGCGSKLPVRGAGTVHEVTRGTAGCGRSAGWLRSRG
jgi:Enoyl-(Acyl carrier protein) reductase